MRRQRGFADPVTLALILTAIALLIDRLNGGGL
jgi:multisubunit Na+/H+ antiporter MnhC subunit